jgi:anti-sigma factor RsiW
MARINRLSAEQRDNLVAYLDGELDDRSAQEIEQVLATSPVARHDVDMLSRTWDLVGVLPGAKVSEDFTRKTLSSLRAAEAPRFQGLSPSASRFIRRGASLLTATATVAALGLAGFLTTNRWIPNESEQILEELEILENLDKYTDVGNVEFLKLLKFHRVFDADETPEE